MKYREIVENTLARIIPADEKAMEAARARQDDLAKPPRSLGQLEEIGIRLAGMTGKVHNEIRRRRIVVLCADNGVWDEGVSSSPRSVTLAQTINLTRGLTGASSLARHFGDEIRVVDVGVHCDVPCAAVVNRKVAYGTKNFRHEPAMTREQAYQAMAAGIEQAEQAKAERVDILGVGEMGVGNTTTSSAVLAALTGLAIEDVTGRGGGLLDKDFQTKKKVIAEALEKHCPDRNDPIDVLSKVGGFDLCAMCGVFLGAAANHIPVVIDGFISVVAALCASRMSAHAKEYFFPSHASFELGYAHAIGELGLEPFLTLGMRLGEGSGCPLAFLIIEAACAIMNEMGTFQEAAIDGTDLEEIRAGDQFTVQ